MEGTILLRFLVASSKASGQGRGAVLKPVRTPMAIFGSLGGCIYVPARRHRLISCSTIHLT